MYIDIPDFHLQAIHSKRRRQSRRLRREVIPFASSCCSRATPVAEMAFEHVYMMNFSSEGGVQFLTLNI